MVRHAVDGSTFRHVVTGIIQRHRDGKLLVVQRSQQVYLRAISCMWSAHRSPSVCSPGSLSQVGSFQLHWGGVSGFLEPGDTSLVQRALIEATEEVGLRALRYVRCGRPLLVDGGPQRQFAVHPVLLLDDSDTQDICLNWENIDYKWVNRSVLPTLQHVPQLPETAARVLPDPPLEAALQWLEADRAHGAAELASFVLDAMQGVVHALQQDDGSCAATRDAVLDAAYHLATCRPSMAPLANAALACVQNVAAVVEAGGSAQEVLQAVQTVCRWYCMHANTHLE